MIATDPQPGDRFEYKPRHWLEVTRREGDNVYFTDCGMPMYAALDSWTWMLNWMHDAQV